MLLALFKYLPKKLCTSMVNVWCTLLGMIKKSMRLVVVFIYVHQITLQDSRLLLQCTAPVDSKRKVCNKLCATQSYGTDNDLNTAVTS